MQVRKKYFNSLDHSFLKKKSIFFFSGFKSRYFHDKNTKFFDGFVILIEFPQISLMRTFFNSQGAVHK